jgi:probable rRNA maturation factor
MSVDIEVEVEADDWLNLTGVEGRVREAALAALAGRDEGAVSVLLADDAAVRELNAEWRGKDKATNVLSFPAAPSAAPHLGDVALAYETCAREAAEQGKPLEHHLSHLVAHGVLHLLGWDHESDDEAEAMEAHEREILAGLGVPDPYAVREAGHG